MIWNPPGNFFRKWAIRSLSNRTSGVGACDTWKITNEQELEQFFQNLPSIPYIMEEFVPGEICSYDAIVNSKGTVLFETGNVTPISIMDSVNTHGSIRFYIVDQVADDLKAAGRACLKAFRVKSRFVHLEFFRLTEDHPIWGPKDRLWDWKSICARLADLLPTW